MTDDEMDNSNTITRHDFVALGPSKPSISNAFTNLERGLRYECG